MHAVVRRIRADEGSSLKAVRLAALTDAPSAFGSSFADEVGRPDLHWTSRAAGGAAGDHEAIFVAVDDGAVVGLAGGYRPDPGGRSVDLVSMWVSPQHRRTGLAARLVDAVVTWAHAAGATDVGLWVTRGNDAAERLYLAAGFVPTGDYQPLPSDPCKDELRMRRSLP